MAYLALGFGLMVWWLCRREDRRPGPHDGKDWRDLTLGAFAMVAMLLLVASLIF